MNSSGVFFFVYYNGQMVTTKEEGVTFSSEETTSMAIRKGITLDQLKQTVLSRIRCGDGKTVTDLHYRCPISIVSDRVQYRAFKLHDDVDVDTMFSIFHEHPQLTCIELYATITGDEAGASIQPEAVSEDDRNAEIMNEIMEEKTKGFNDTPWWYTLYGSVTSEEWVQYNLSPSQNSR